MTDNDNETGTKKRKSRRAVFENALEKNETLKVMFRGENIDELSNSGSELIIDDDFEVTPKKKRSRIEKKLSMSCAWRYCDEKFSNYDNFNKHLKEEHVESYDIVENDGQFKCHWKQCEHCAISLAHLNQHVCFHGYHAKLMSVGDNVVARNNLPDCVETKRFPFVVSVDGYKCEWEFCQTNYTTIYDFIQHVRIHVNGNPKSQKTGVIKCLWKGCDRSNFSKQYFLSLHMRVHTKDKEVACSTCGGLFQRMNKMLDHRTRQMPRECEYYLL